MIIKPYAFLAVFSLCELVAGGTVIPRGVNDVLSTIKTITSQCLTINHTLSGFEEGFSVTGTALKLQGQATTLLDDINKGTTTVSKSSKLSSNDSATVANSVVSLSTTVYSLLDGFIAKKPGFDKAILDIGSASFLVEFDLKKLKNATASYGDAVVDVLSNDIEKVAPLMTGDLAFHFTEAIDVFKFKL